MTLSEIFEGLTAIGLFMSVALVFSELRRNGMEARLNNWINYTQRVFDARNTVVDLDIADIIVRGRKNLQNLSETEQLVFKKYLLNSALTAMSFTVLGGVEDMVRQSAKSNAYVLLKRNGIMTERESTGQKSEQILRWLMIANC